MKSSRPKVAFEVCGWALVRHVVETVALLRPEKIVVVVGHGREEVEKALAGVPGVTYRVQKEQNGTGDAVKSALPALRGFDGTVLVLNGDGPLVRRKTLSDLLGSHRRRKAACSIVSALLGDGAAYGRIVRTDRGDFAAIRESKDCTPGERAITEIYTGLAAFEIGALRWALRRIRTDNAQGEYYLTDAPAILLAKGEKVLATPCGTADDGLGVNTFAELADAAARMRSRILAELMASGVEVTDPATTFVDRGVRIGRGTRILPCTVIERDVVIGAGCEVGPFSHVRPGTVMEDGAEVGNFVETKKAHIGRHTKAKHLTYLGDTKIGAGTNIGCGTITANYDGKNKHVTTIGGGVHIGSGTVLVAPVRVGDGATTGAGAIVTKGSDVPPGEVVVGIPARRLERRST